MNFRLLKLRVALGIIIVGTLLALIWCACEGWGLGRGYPYNTYCYLPEERYGDFIQCLRFAALPGVHSNYFPAAYFIFYPFLHLNRMVAAILFLNLCVIGLYVTLNAAMENLLPQPGWRIISCVVFLWCFPVVYALDRANIEILLVLLTAAAIFFYSRKKFAASFFFLLPAICFKLYPGVLLLLFVRRKLLHWAILGGLLFFVINGGILVSLPGTLAEKLSEFSSEMATYNEYYILGQRGVSNSASAWNLFRICVWSGYSWWHNSFTWPMPESVIKLTLSIYYNLFLVVLALVVTYALLVEKTFARRAVILLLYVTVSAPGGAEYKLCYVAIALVIFILVPQRRPGDLMIAIALAFCLIPKREIILNFCGPSDSGHYDSSLNVIVNPIFILGSMVLLMWDGWNNFTPPLDYRLAKLAYALRIGRLYRKYVPPAPVPVRAIRRKGRQK